MPIHVEEAIQEAQRDGRFDNLPGAGKPLALDPSPDAVVNNLLRDAKMRPAWIEVDLEIDALLERAARQMDDFARRHAADFAALTETPTPIQRVEPFWRRWWRVFWTGSDNRLRGRDPVVSFNRHWNVEMARQAALLHEANRKIRRFNRLVPLRDLQRNAVPIAERLEAFARRFPKLAHTGAGKIAPLFAQVPPSLLQPGDKLESDSLPRTVRQQRILETRR